MYDRLSCRYVPYPLAAKYARVMICNPIGWCVARRRAISLFRVLDEAGVVYDPSEVAMRASMFHRLFPWAYCRFAVCPTGELDQWIRVSGLNNITSLCNARVGVLVVTGHFGAGHALKYILNRKGYRVNSVRKRGWFVRKYSLVPGTGRNPGEIHIVDDDSIGQLKTTASVRDILRQGGIVSCALDGTLGSSEGLCLSILGHKRQFRTALPLAAVLAGARIVPQFAALESDGHIHIRIDSPLSERRSDQTPAQYAEEMTRAYVEKAEAFCRMEPGMLNMKHFV